MIGKGNNWNDIRMKRLKKILGDIHTCFLGYSIWNQRTTQGVPFAELNAYDLILGYNAEHGVYVAWSATAHQIIESKAKEHTFSLHIKARKLLGYTEPIMCFYQRLEGTKKSEYTALEYYEKVVLVHEEYIEEFCKNPLLYLMPNCEDKGYKENTVYEDVVLHRLSVSNAKCDGIWHSKEERTRYNCNRQSRDRLFRKSVLNTYGCKCAICGETIEKVLQAAHIIAVKDGGNDVVENGVCLCANHHLMFDSGMFRIDPRTRMIYGIDPSLSDKIEEKYV